MRYKTKQIEIEAKQVSNDNSESIASWCGGDTVKEFNDFDYSKVHMGVNVPTLSGVLRASEGDYVVRTPLGGFNVCKKNSFENQYELA